MITLHLGERFLLDPPRAFVTNIKCILSAIKLLHRIGTLREYPIHLLLSIVNPDLALEAIYSAIVVFHYITDEESLLLYRRIMRRLGRGFNAFTDPIVVPVLIGFPIIEPNLVAILIGSTRCLGRVHNRTIKSNQETYSRLDIQRLQTRRIYS